MSDWSDEDERRWAASSSPKVAKAGFITGIWIVRFLFAVPVAAILWEIFH